MTPDKPFAETAFTGKAPIGGILLLMAVSIFLLSSIALGQGVTAEEKTAISQEPPDGEWLVDADGEYFLQKYPKVEGTYRWVDKEKKLVRLRYFMPYRVMEEDDENFYLRIDRIKLRDQRPAKKPQRDINEIKAEYPGDVEVADLFALEGFDRGLPRSGQWRNGFDLADMNEDGFLDIVHGAPRKGAAHPVIFLGDGKGGWTVWQTELPTDFVYDYGDVATADFDGDGHMDMALAVHLRGLVVLLGDGKGKFRPGHEGLPVSRLKGRTSSSFTSRSLEVLDWNLDGRPDLVAISEGPTDANQIADGIAALPGLRVFINQPDMTWQVVDPGEDYVFGDHVEVADLNNDRRPDLVHDARVLGYRTLVKLAREDGTFESVELKGLREMAFVWAVAPADVDGDGNGDIVLSYRSNVPPLEFRGIDIFYGDGSGTDYQRVGLFSTTEGRDFRELEVADMDGDGKQDVVALRSDGDAWFFFGRGNRKFMKEESPETVAPESYQYCAGYKARLEDLDGDGTRELIAGFAGEPGSETLYGILPKCQPKGALRAWKLTSPSAGDRRAD